MPLLSLETLPRLIAQHQSLYWLMGFASVVFTPVGSTYVPTSCLLGNKWISDQVSAGHRGLLEHHECHAWPVQFERVLCIGCYCFVRSTLLEQFRSETLLTSSSARVDN